MAEFWGLSEKFFTTYIRFLQYPPKVIAAPQLGW